MARVCFFCRKKPLFGNKVSHSNIKTRSRSLPNLRRVKHVSDQGTLSIYACSRCLRSGRVHKPGHRMMASP